MPFITGIWAPPKPMVNNDHRALFALSCVMRLDVPSGGLSVCDSGVTFLCVCVCVVISILRFQINPDLWAVMRSDQAYTMAGIAVKCRNEKYQIILWMTLNRSGLQLIKPSETTLEMHRPRNVNILDFNVLVKSNVFPIRIVCRLGRAHSFAAFLFDLKFLCAAWKKMLLAFPDPWLHLFASFLSTALHPP